MVTILTEPEQGEYFSFTDTDSDIRQKRPTRAALCIRDPPEHWSKLKSSPWRQASRARNNALRTARRARIMAEVAG
eukprot:408520-Pyramimonas_sp.AAC.1